jgi:hypothetical protein
MPLVNLWEPILVSADTNDILSASDIFQALGKGTYRVTAKAAAAVDATITINDGKQNVVNAHPVLTGDVGTTYPEMDLSGDKWYTILYTGSLRPIIDIVDGTNGELVVIVQKVA